MVPLPAPAALAASAQQGRRWLDRQAANTRRAVEGASLQVYRASRSYAGGMERSIVSFRADQQGEWVAELSCGHDQHVRHRPPFQDRQWVVDKADRDGRVGAPLDCPLCERAELPGELRFVRSGRQWDVETVPAGLVRSHRIANGTWGRIAVTEGRLRFSATTTPPLEVVLGPSEAQAIPPNVEHHVEPVGAVRFTIDFFAVDRGPPAFVAPPTELILPPERPEIEEGAIPPAGPIESARSADHSSPGTHTGTEEDR